MKNSDFPSVQSVMDDLTGRTGQKEPRVAAPSEQLAVRRVDAESSGSPSLEDQRKMIGWARDRLALGDLTRAGMDLRRYALPLKKGKHTKTPEVRIPVFEFEVFLRKLEAAERLMANK